jgi:hypothetical protein
MPKTSVKALAALASAGFLFALWPAQVFADDFGDIVHHIEARYHAHRNYRFLMAFAGFTVKLWDGTGVKDVKIAYFENQNLFQSDPDTELDDILRTTGKTGWRQMLKSVSRRRGQRSYIYAQPSGKDMKLLVVNVEHNEAEVIQVKINPDKMERFIGEHQHHGHEDQM